MKRNKLFILLSLTSISSVATLPLVAGSCNHNKVNETTPEVKPTPQPGTDPGNKGGDKETPAPSTIVTDGNISFDTKKHVLTIKDVKKITPDYLWNLYQDQEKKKKLKLEYEDGILIGGIKLVCPDATELVTVSKDVPGLPIKSIEFPKLENVITTLPNETSDIGLFNLIKELEGDKIVQNGILLKWNNAYGDISDDTITTIIRNAFDATTYISKINLPNLKFVQPYGFGTIDKEPFPMIEGKLIINNIVVKWPGANGNIIDSDITEIYNDAFKDNNSLYTVNFDNVTTVCDGAFEGSQSLGYIKFPKVKTIGSRAFANCWHLNEADLQEVVTIGESAFEDDTELSQITCPNVKEIGKNAFNNTPKLETKPTVKTE
ncbi:leucine-rich repeat protein [Mycoplasma sp. 1458C]|uniref:leucine-rich repeat protein n=1 Tax=unclassified Mycoplasma TaxID=2683645 RepID=UPI003AAD42AA